VDRGGRAEVGPTPSHADQSRPGTRISDPVRLLAAGEWAAFHGDPAAGVGPLRALLATGSGAGRARWLLGVCLGALGRYAEAAAVLEPALATDPLAATARASHLRQLERHAEAEVLDRAALDLAAAGSYPERCYPERSYPGGPDPARPDLACPDPAGRDPAGRALAGRDPAGPDPARLDPAGQALADALTGLVADAVGRLDVATATERLAGAAAAATAAAGWRPRVRLAWVSAEVALLSDRPAAAARQAARALRLATAASAPRHVAKSLLFRGVAEHVLADPAAVRTLDLAARAAQDLGLLPLVWPARLVRSRILAVSDPEAAQGDLAVAHAAMRAISVGLLHKNLQPISPNRGGINRAKRT
jgi:tetratricopeptide (TPR) repeat protein